jgi:hypothetical protein
MFSFKFCGPDCLKKRGRKFLVIVILVNLVNYSCPATADTELTDSYYIVEDFTGSVLLRGPYSPVWESPEKGDRIPEGYLLQTLDGSIAKLRYVPKDRSIASLGGSLTLRIDTPIVVRLDRDILRQVAVSTNFVEKLPALDAKFSALEAEDFTLQSAWSKVTAAAQAGLSQAGLGSSADDNSKDKKGVQSSVEGRKIIILTPYPGQKFRAVNLPQEILVKWKAVDAKDVAYRVYFWRSSRKRPPPVGLSRRNQFTVVLPMVGKYQLQITSEDGLWQSEVHSIELIDGTGGQFARVGDNVSGSVDSGLNLLYPSESFEVLSTGDKVVDFFRWEMVPDGREWQYEWVLQRKNGVELRRLTTSESFVRQKIPAGEYLWYVEAIVRNQPSPNSNFGSVLSSANKYPPRPGREIVSRFRSKPRLLRVIQTVGTEQQQKRLSEFVRSGAQGSIYLTEGL